MQVNDKYRFVLLIILFIGLFLLLTLTGTVKKNLEKSNAIDSEYHCLHSSGENVNDETIQNAGFFINSNDTIMQEPIDFEPKQEMKIVF